MWHELNLLSCRLGLIYNVTVRTARTNAKSADLTMQVQVKHWANQRVRHNLGNSWCYSRANNSFLKLIESIPKEETRQILSAWGIVDSNNKMSIFKFSTM